MKAILLGSGTSAGVPRIGNDWGECDPDEPRNRRSRVSLLVQIGDKNILVDTSPDLREQLLRNNIAQIDAVIWTHDHADHSHGIDDLRAVFHRNREPITGYGRDYTLDSLRSRFSYIFSGNKGYPAIITTEPLIDTTEICLCKVFFVDQPHGPVFSTGLMFQFENKSIVYATDFSNITDEMCALYDECDVLIVDCLRRTPHPTHAHLEMALDLAERVKARQTILTHMDKSLDYRTLVSEVPHNIVPGYDGLCISI